jgi:hypothetical protein
MGDGNMYVIKRNDGAYVTPPGSFRSYTQRIQDARVFQSKETAEKERCPGNESVVTIENELRGLY